METSAPTPEDSPERSFSKGRTGRGGAFQAPPVAPNLQLLMLNFLEERPNQEGTLLDFVNHSGLSRETAGEIASSLWFEGMIRKGGPRVSWTTKKEKDPFLVPLRLTRFAREVLANPEGPLLWLNGENTDPYRPQSRFEAAIFRRVPWPVTRIFLGAILLVFLGGLIFAATFSFQTAEDYFLAKESNPQVIEILRLLGMEEGKDWEEGRWWVPLQANFVHIGFLHLVMNGMALWMLGGHVERVYGSLPFFLICLGGGWMGGALHLAWWPFGGAGASAALSGVIAADGVWYLMNRSMLSKRVRQLWGQQVTINTSMLVLISLMKGVSSAGHLGGAIGGGIIALAWLGWSTGSQAVGLRILRGVLVLGGLVGLGVGLINLGQKQLESWDQYRILVHYQPLEKQFLNSVLNPVLDLKANDIFFLERTPPRFRLGSHLQETLGKIQDLRGIIGEEKKKWEVVPRSERQDQPDEFMRMMDSLSGYLEQTHTYLGSGKRMDPETLDRLENGWSEFQTRVSRFFEITKKTKKPSEENQP